MLCLVGKGTEAVGYLQSYGQWRESVWLAKCCPHLQARGVGALQKWAQHLQAQGDKVGGRGEGGGTW